MNQICTSLHTVGILTAVNMADDSNMEGENENILYDLLINTEWPPETDTQVCQNFTFGRFGQLHSRSWNIIFECVMLSASLAGAGGRATSPKLLSLTLQPLKS